MSNLPYRLSATAISAFKACPVRYHLGYRIGIRAIEDTESLRVGTNWHAMHEFWNVELKDEPDQQARLRKLAEHLNTRYERIPAYMTLEDAEVEQAQLIASFIGYLWYYQNQPLKILGVEQEFEMALKTVTGRCVPFTKGSLKGKVDAIVEGQAVVLERKSTKKSIDPASDYWESRTKDTQVSVYGLAWRESGAESFNVLYDVWHKPSIKPTTLTQGDSAEFAKTGLYCGDQFTVSVEATDATDPNNVTAVVDGKIVVVVPGETPRMYRARLLQDIQTRPDFYYQRRLFTRTEKELAEFEQTITAIYTAMQMFEKKNCWFENETACRATYPCSFIPICYGCGYKAVDPANPPSGFRCIHRAEYVALPEEA
jgi:hypothetical protein